MQEGAALDAEEYTVMHSMARKLQRVYRHHANAAFIRVLHRMRSTLIQRRYRRHLADVARRQKVALREEAARAWQGFLRKRWIARAMLHLSQGIKIGYLGSLRRYAAQMKVGKLHSQFHREKRARLEGDFAKEQMFCVALAARIFRLSRRLDYGQYFERKRDLAALRYAVEEGERKKKRALVRFGILTGAVSQIRIKQQPVNVQAIVGGPASFDVMAVCIRPRGLKFVWERRGEVMRGKQRGVSGDAIRSTFSIDRVTEADEGTYVCTVVDRTGQIARTQHATLKVLSKPFLSSHPQSLTVSIYGHAKLTVRAVSDGNLPLRFRWLKDGVFMRGTASENSLELANFAPLDVGTYACEVSNDAGTVTTRDAFLTLSPHA